MVKKGDIILFAVVLLLVVGGFGIITIYKGIDDGEHNIAVIKQNDQIIATIDLDKIHEPQRIKLPGDYEEIILVEKGKIRFEEADCPDLVCVRTGWLTQKGDMAVCLPNKAIIRIEGEKRDVDGATY